MKQSKTRLKGNRVQRRKENVGDAAAARPSIDCTPYAHNHLCSVSDVQLSQQLDSYKGQWQMHIYMRQGAVSPTHGSISSCRQCRRKPPIFASSFICMDEPYVSTGKTPLISSSLGNHETLISAIHPRLCSCFLLLLPVCYGSRLQVGSLSGGGSLPAPSCVRVSRMP